MAAGHRGVLDDGDRRVGLAEHEVGQRAGLHQLLGGHLGGSRLAALRACGRAPGPRTRQGKGRRRGHAVSAGRAARDGAGAMPMVGRSVTAGSVLSGSLRLERCARRCSHGRGRADNIGSAPNKANRREAARPGHGSVSGRPRTLGAEPGERVAQAGIGHVGHLPRQRLGRLRAAAARDRGSGGSTGACTRRSSAIGRIAEIGVDALDDLAGLVLHVERAGAIDPQHQRGPGPALARAGSARPSSVRSTPRGHFRRSGAV